MIELLVCILVIYYSLYTYLCLVRLSCYTHIQTHTHTIYTYIYTHTYSLLYISSRNTMQQTKILSLKCVKTVKAAQLEIFTKRKNLHR